MVTAESLVAVADKIDRRVGPIPGRDADRIAVMLREAAEQIADIRHPTGSEQLAAALADLGVPAPWRLCDEEVGEVLAANGAIACDADTVGCLSEDDASRVAALIMLAVNTLAGFKAEAPK